MENDSSPLTPADLKRLTRLRSKHKQIPIHEARKEIIKEYGAAQKVQNRSKVEPGYFLKMSKLVEGKFKKTLYRSTEHDVMYDFNRESGEVYPCPTWEDGVLSHCRAHFKNTRVGKFEIERRFNASFPPSGPSGEELWFELTVADFAVNDEAGLYWITAVPTLKELDDLYAKAKQVIEQNGSDDRSTLSTKLDEIDVGRRRYRAGKLQLIF